MAAITNRPKLHLIVRWNWVRLFDIEIDLDWKIEISKKQADKQRFPS